MDNDEFQKAKNEIIEKARVDAGACTTVEARQELVKNRSVAILALLKDNGMAKNNLDTCVSIMAMAHAAGMNALRAGIDFAAVVDQALAGRETGMRYAARELIDNALTRMAANPQGEA